MKTITKDQKLEIKAFISEFKALSKQHTALIPVLVKVPFWWDSDMGPSFEEQHWLESQIKKSSHYLSYKANIRNFCKRTEDWGRKHFNDKNWLWTEYLWKMS